MILHLIIYFQAPCYFAEKVCIPNVQCTGILDKRQDVLLSLRKVDIGKALTKHFFNIFYRDLLSFRNIAGLSKSGSILSYKVCVS